MADEIKQTVVIEASITKLQQDLAKVKDEFKSTFGQIANIGNSALNSIGIGLGAGSLVAFVKQVVDVGDQLSDLSAQTGLSIEVLGGIKPVLDASNSSLDGFAKGINKAQGSLGDLQGAGKEAAVALKAIGLNPTDLANASPDEFLEKLVAALAKVENGNERAAIATRVLGRSAAELIPTVLQLAEKGIPKLSQATAEAYARLGELKDQLVEVGAAIINFSALAITSLGQLFGLIAQSPTQQLGALEAQFDRLANTVRAFTNVPVERLQAMTTEQLRDLATKTQVGEARQNLEQMIQIRDAQNKVSAEIAKPPKTQGAFKGLLPPEAAAAGTDALKNATKAAQAFLETIDKEIIRLQEQNIAFFQGADAAKKFALEQELLAKKQQVVAELIGRGISPANANKAVAQAFAGIDTEQLSAKIAAAREEFIKLSREALNSQAVLQKVFDVQDADKLADQFKTVINRIHEAQAEIKDSDLIKGTVQAIEAEFKKAQDQTKLFADVFGDAFDKSGHDVDDLRDKLSKLLKELKLGKDNELVIKTKAELDQKSVDDVKEQLHKQLEDIQQRGAIFGPSQVNVPAEIAQAQRQAAEKLIGQRTPQATGEAQRIAPQAQESRIAGVIQDMNREMREAAAQAEVLGGAVDLPAANVDALTNAIKRLIAEGLDPLDPRIQELKRELEDAKAAEHFADAFKGIGQAVGDALNQLGQGGKFKDILKNMVAQIQRSVTDALVTKPFQEWLQKIANEIFGIKPGGTGAGGQEASTKIFSTSTNQFAMAVQQFAAAAGVRGTATPLPIGQGERPAGVEGPTLPNGGFYGGPQGEMDTAGMAGGESLVAEPGQALKGFLDALGAGIFGGLPMPGMPGLGGILGQIFGIGKTKGTPIGTVNVGGGAAGGIAGETADQVAITGIQAEVTAAQASIEGLSTEATTAIQAASTEASAAIEAANTAGTTALETTSSTAQAAIEAIQAEAIAAIQAAATAAQSSGGSSSMGGSFAGGPSAYSGSLGGMGMFAASAHQGGMIGKLHGGGKAGDVSAMDFSGVKSEAVERIMKQFAALKPDEVPIIGKKGEIMMSEEAVRAIGAPLLLEANKNRRLPRLHLGGPMPGFTLPRLHDGGPVSATMLREASSSSMPAPARAPEGSTSGGHVIVEAHFHDSARDYDSFRRNQASFEATLARGVQKGMKRI